MNNRNENRPGYKLTKVGWIPESWQCVHLGQSLAKIIGGGTPSKTKSYYWNGTIPWATVKDITRQNPNDTIDHISVKGLDNSSSNLIAAHTIIIATRMVVGGCLRFNIDVAINQDLKALIPNSKLNAGYMFWLLTAAKPALSRLGFGSTVDGIRIEDIRFIFIPLPPVEEQERIAGVLSAWDRAIEQVGSLIKAKKQLKKGLMQQLLTGRMRFPQFGQPVKEKGKLPDGWQLVRLGDAMKIIVSGVDKKAVPGQAVVNLCNYMDVYKNNYITSDLDFMQATASNNEIDKLSIKKNDVLITKDSETSDDIGVPAVVTEELKGVVCGYHLALMRPRQNDIDSVFLTQQLQLPIIKNQFTRLANGVTRFGLTTSALQRPNILLPRLKEQALIAKQISNIDDQIELLAKKEEALRQQKKGLMQKLLTGEIRVYSKTSANIRMEDERR